MGFFDDLGKKVAGAGQKTMQKTKELSDVVRLNSLISQEENKINNAYYQIGKLYVSIHGNDGEEEFAGLINNVVELEQNVKNLRKQVQDIKGVQRCEKCGAEVPRGVAFCSSCGVPMPRKEQQNNLSDYVKCPSCGNDVKKGMRFCTSCGKPMSQLTEFSSEAQPANFTELHEEVHGKKCPNCGAKIEADTVFCVECGTKVGEHEEVMMNDEIIEQPLERKCPNCGEVLTEDALFCTKCGTKV